MHIHNKANNLKISFFMLISIIIVLTFCFPISSSADEESITALRQMGKAFSSIAGKTSPAVVGIKSERRTESLINEELWDRFLGPQYRGRQQQQQQPQQQTQPRRNQEPPTTQTQGSGFIITPDGYIITNNHLVENTEKIEIELNNGRTYFAEITGTDPESDIAVIKIDANDLPYLEFADSDKLEVGEWVLAIGNPLGLAHTVTAGIVSAVGRSGFDLNILENYIQTDAAINFGNSGGPLINLDGKVVGINTAIAGSTGSIGLGFAVPINMAKYAYEEIISNGVVERGLLGIKKIETLTQGKAPIYGLDKDAKGVIFPIVIRNSAADKAGLTHRDVILEIDGKPVETAEELQNRIALLKPGTEVELTIWRNNKREKLPITLGKRSELVALETEQQIEETETLLGFTVQDISEETDELYGYEGTFGVVVTDVPADSEARRSGVSVGILIKEVNHQIVRNINEFAEEVENARKNGRNILLWANINGQDRNIFIEIN